MATIDEKLLDGPSVGYCSSSDEEEEGQNGGGVAGMSSSFSSAVRGGKTQRNDDPSDGAAPSDGTPRTGPKGVLADFERFRREKAARDVVDEAKFLEAANRFSLTHKPKDAATGQADEMGDDELERIRCRRVEQLKNMARGRILEVSHRLEFLSLIENESCNGTLLFIHIYNDGNEQSDQLNDALLELAGRMGSTRTAKGAKFYKVQAKVLGTSAHFALNALPALQVYRDEHLIGNFIRLSADLGDDYAGGELYTFLRGHGIPLELDDVVVKC